MSALTTPEHRAALARDILRNHGCLHPHDVGDGTTVRCGFRFVEKCPSCADIYANDWKAILRSGLDAPKDAPACAFFFWTLTAPSFGKIHAVPSDNRKKERRRRCTCGKKHTANDHHLRGVPVDLDSYDLRERSDSTGISAVSGTPPQPCCGTATPAQHGRPSANGSDAEHSTCTR